MLWKLSREVKQKVIFLHVLPRTLPADYRGGRMEVWHSVSKCSLVQSNWKIHRKYFFSLSLHTYAHALYWHFAYGSYVSLNKQCLLFVISTENNYWLRYVLRHSIFTYDANQREKNSILLHKCMILKYRS